MAGAMDAVDATHVSSQVRLTAVTQALPFYAKGPMGISMVHIAETVEASALAWVAKDMVVPVRPARGRCRQYLPGRHALGMRPCSFGSESSRRRKFTDGSGFGPSADHSVANAARSPSHCSSALTRTVTMHARKDMLVINCVKRTSQP